MTKKPAFLYCGRRNKCDIINPSRPQCKPGEKENDTDYIDGIYASAEKNHAILYSITINPDKDGITSWHGVGKPGDEVPKIVIEKGSIDLSKKGYLYKLPSDTFEKLDSESDQWISKTPVVPLDCETIDPVDYAQWFIEKMI